MSDENNKLYTVELTEDEIDQCTHALSELCEVLHKEDNPSFLPRMKDHENTIEKLSNVLTKPTTNTDRFAMGTPDVAHAGENKDSNK